MSLLNNIKTAAKGKVQLHKEGWRIFNAIGKGQVAESQLCAEDKKVISTVRKETGIAVGVAIGTAIISSLLD